MDMGPIDRQAQETVTIETAGRGYHELTEAAHRFVAASGIGTGQLTVFCRHTSASLMIQENASPEVLDDLDDFFEGLAPTDPTRYRHGLEGPDDMPAHLRSAVTGVSLTIPVVKGRLALGTWQGIFLIEHRLAGHRRQVVLHAVGS